MTGQTDLTLVRSCRSSIKTKVSIAPLNVDGPHQLCSCVTQLLLKFVSMTSHHSHSIYVNTFCLQFKAFQSRYEMSLTQSTADAESQFKFLCKMDLDQTWLSYGCAGADLRSLPGLIKFKSVNCAYNGSITSNSLQCLEVGCQSDDFGKMPLHLGHLPELHTLNVICQHSKYQCARATTIKVHSHSLTRVISIGVICVGSESDCNTNSPISTGTIFG